MILGYNPNGFAHHRLDDALAILSELGYKSAAITLEREQLDPPDRSGVPACVKRIHEALSGTGLRCTIETGSRFLLDPRRKHQPTLLSPDDTARRRRIDFLVAAIDVAAELGADSVSIWSGSSEVDEPEHALVDRLCGSLEPVLHRAEACGVQVAFEPEPGMLMETMDQFARLHSRLSHPSFGLTLDVGHVHCLSDGTVGEHARRWRDSLWNVHLDDARRGIHEHLMFGEGEIDVPRALRDLRDAGYVGPVHVELSRHAHDAVRIARHCLETLAPHFQMDTFR
jgi:sugar phosphate isomerase/epimerase